MSKKQARATIAVLVVAGCCMPSALVFPPQQHHSDPAAAKKVVEIMCQALIKGGHRLNDALVATCEPLRFPYSN